MAFLKEYNGHVFQDDGPYCSKDFKSFARKFKNYLAKNLPEDCQIIDHKCGHYDLYGFVGSDDGKYIYYRWSWNRFSAVDVEDGRTMANAVLYRTAKGPKDYTGGRNQYCSIKKLPESIVDLLKQVR